MAASEHLVDIKDIIVIYNIERCTMCCIIYEKVFIMILHCTTGEHCVSQQHTLYYFLSCIFSSCRLVR